MTDRANPEREGFRVTVTPYLCAQDAPRAIAFYVQAFGAEEVFRLLDDAGRVSHAEIRIGVAPIYLSDEHPESGALSPESVGGSPVLLVLEVEDVDAMFHQAVAAGATVDRPLMDTFDGAMRNGKVCDPFGHRWMLLTNRQKLTSEALKART